jgi:hypothetical protein
MIVPLVYPTTYRAKSGEETTVIQNDGKTLRMSLRGVEFSGRSFHWFEPSEEYDESELESFTLFRGELCSYSLDCDIPVLVVDGTRAVQAVLCVHADYGEPVEGLAGTYVRSKDGTVTKDSRQIDREVLQLTLAFDGESFTSGGKHLYHSFDEQLSEIKALFPKDVYLKTCWNCAFADYHPAGSGAFGRLACFRSLKDEYAQVRSKRDLFAVWDKRAEDVQEVHLCEEFEKRQPGTGWHWPLFE